MEEIFFSLPYSSCVTLLNTYYHYYYYYQLRAICKMFSWVLRGQILYKFTQMFIIIISSMDLNSPLHTTNDSVFTVNTNYYSCPQKLKKVQPTLIIIIITMDSKKLPLLFFPQLYNHQSLNISIVSNSKLGERNEQHSSSLLYSHYHVPIPSRHYLCIRKSIAIPVMPRTSCRMQYILNFGVIKTVLVH